MADSFLDAEAELGSSSEDDRSLHSSDNGEIDDLDEQPKKRKEKKGRKKRAAVHSDDDEEDGEDLDQDLPGLINDNIEEEEEGSDVEDGDGAGSGGEGGKRQRDSDIDEDLEDEDYELLEENLGIKIDRHKRRRIKSVSDDEDESAAAADNDDGKVVIENEIFGSDDDEMSVSGTDRSERRDSSTAAAAGVGSSQEFGDLEQSDEESDEDDFIVDDEGKPISKGKKKRHIIHDDVALQEAQDIFGVDFDFEEFEQYDEEDEDEEVDDYEQDVEDDDEARPRPQKHARKRRNKKPITQLYEPIELEQSHYTDFDQEVRMADMPERFQLRNIPVCPTEEGELEEEAEWIYRHAFSTPPLSRQEYYEQEGRHGYGSRASKGPSTVGKIQEALNLMRNQKFETPFIAFYRKEHIDPELTIRDLWTVYRYDEKWMQLRSRKQNLIRLFEQMQQYQFEQLEGDQPLESHVRALTDEDVDRVRGIQSLEELQDIYQHFLLYYGNDVSKMKQALKTAKKKQREQQRLENGDEQEQEEEPPDDDNEPTLKQATRKSGYTLCIEAGLVDLARKFGLTAEQFGENLRDCYQRHEVEQDQVEPRDLAQQFIKGQFQTVDDVLNGARHIVAMQISHDPVVRSCLRQTFHERAKITLHITKKGMKEIDESHFCYTFKYLKNKPVSDLTEDQFIKITQAEKDQLLTYEIHIDERDNSRFTSYFDEIQPLYHRDEFSNLVQEWNEQRKMALERALTQILYPQMIRELKVKLLEEGKESIVRASCMKLYNWLKVAPYQVDETAVDDDELSSARGLRVMAVSYSTVRDEVSFCAVVDGDGEVTDFLRLPHIMKRRNGWNKEEAAQKEKEIQKLKDFIASKRPHVIVVGADSREASSLMEDLKGIVEELEQEQQMSLINIELVDIELARVFANSKKAEQDLREYPLLLRQAVSLARRLQDPLVEFAQLCNSDEDILALHFHPLQDVVKDELLEPLYLEFVNRVNEVGVDVNRCITHPHTASLIQFVCGLGPRKGYHLLKTLKQYNSRLENRTQLVTLSHVRMGPKVFINCAGFIKIDTKALAESNTDTYVEPLDSTRIHPETYDWARKMAVDALEYDDTAEDANPAGALEEILESPDRLKDLDLDAFAEELERQGYGAKHITLYDIRAELSKRYKDLRTTYRSPTVEECFNLLTKETPDTFYIGKLIMCRVTGIAHRRPNKEQLEVANPVRNDETGLWQCPFCDKKDFPELSEVWSHFDTGGCPGQAVGIRTRLDNGVSGFIPLKNISDKHVTNPEERVQFVVECGTCNVRVSAERRCCRTGIVETSLQSSTRYSGAHWTHLDPLFRVRVQVGMTLHCRITRIDIERFQVELTCKSSDLIDNDSKWKLQKDPFYDFDAETDDKKREDDKRKQQTRQTYIKRVIAHPSFHNIDYKACEKLMDSMDQGDVIIRPSSKGADHLTVTWKVADGALQHIDVREEGKENAFSLGRSLWIGTEAFEDLDEIIARHIQPMAAHARDLLNYKYHVDSNGGQRELLDKILVEDKKKQPSRIPYYMSYSKQYPGKFFLSYLPRKSTHHEFVTVTPEGIRYRSRTFPTIGSMIRWFKEHFRDPIPGTPQSTKTPGVVGGTPINLQNVDVATIQRAAAGLSSSVFNTLQQVAGQQTPFNAPAAAYQQFQTPMMTPSVHPMSTPGQFHTASHSAVRQTPLPQHLQTPVAQFPPLTPRTNVPPAGHWNYQQQQQQQQQTVLSSPRQSNAVWQPTTPAQQQQQQQQPNSASSQDWAKKAQQWASRSTPRATPRTPATGHGASPYTPGGGDSTPLIDER